MIDPLWIFGYGSLMWKPGFAYAERQVAELSDFKRSFCMRSVEHRGTPENPGLVLALEEHAGTNCLGVAFRAEDESAAQTLAYLRERELVTSAYLETVQPVRLTDGRIVRAVTYVMDREHSQYVGDLTAEAQADIISGAEGGMGPNPDYLFGTVEALRTQKIADEDLEHVARLVAGRIGSEFR
ncbi:gamma-glutamylcyclotransferase [Pontivivens insulae]|uniref:glutathione-specific gamma-glutamylcyclotransferase n=1 Tax=Pontivivens insulae TaxID=1639689 RepID=A0A2R8AEU0_9RHOB|nr:gamma-glutamylcyclotransferase [Pontivivens insulae]RED11993.1 cation transport protein ChaC [Pontivivens insulae]SPF30749.1 hypothetical protein POI8812_03092 [Pontivivens insulae]